MADKDLQSIRFPGLANRYTIEGGSGLTDDAKTALLNCFEKVSWIDENGQTYYDALYDALYNTTWSITNNLTGCTTSNDSANVTKGGSYTATITANGGYELSTVTVTMGGTDVTSTAYTSGTISIANVTGNIVITAVATQRVADLVSIAAVFAPGDNVIMDTDALDTLKQYLTVTATYDDSSTATIAAADYTLSGTLAEGTSTITVTYSGKTTTFDVTVLSENVTVVAVFSMTQTIITDGVESTNRDWSTTDYLTVPSGYGLMSAVNTTGNNLNTGRDAWYDSEKTYIGAVGLGTVAGNGTAKTVSVPSNAAYVRLSTNGSAWQSGEASINLVFSPE